MASACVQDLGTLFSKSGPGKGNLVSETVLKATTCFRCESIALSGTSLNAFNTMKVASYNLRPGHWVNYSSRTSNPKSRNRFRLLGNVLRSKSLILQSLSVGGYNLLQSATVIRTFGAGGVDGNIWDSLSVFASCSFLASLNLFYHVLPFNQALEPRSSAISLRRSPLFTWISR